MNLIAINNDKKLELELKIDTCLTILYELEDQCEYKEKTLSNCIDLLQDVQVVIKEEIK